jgi:hypothetical protein
VSNPVWTAEAQARITNWVDKWRGLLLLNSHHINITFSEVACADEGEEKCSAEIRVNYPYMSGHCITVYPRFLMDAPDEQERKVVHELVHILTRRMKGLAHDLLAEKLVTWREVNEHDEHLTDWIANIAFALALHEPAAPHV